MSSESPVSLLRQAAEAAPKVLPASVGDAAATLFDLLRQWSGVPSTVRAGGEALARGVLALAEQQQPRPAEVTVYMARGIRPDSWLHEDRFTAFRHAYSYASAKTHAIPGLSKISAEEAYYVWRIIQHGFEFNERTKDDPRLGIGDES